MLCFSGSRNLSEASKSTLSRVLIAVAGGRWSSIGVGCCPTGLDLFVRQSPVFKSHKHRIFTAKSRSPQDLVARSCFMVELLSGNQSEGGLVAFPGKSCPPGLVPSKTGSKCFCGRGSGTWATAAFSVGRGAPLWVACLSPMELPLTWGTWARSTRFPGCWYLTPKIKQLSLIS